MDDVLDGGLSRAEVGCWIAYAKRGKSTALMHHGVVGTRGLRRYVLHIVLEGTLKQTENRYDTRFSEELYSTIKRGAIDAGAYGRLQAEYEALTRLLVVRAFTQHWEYTALNIEQEIKELRSYGWKPDIVIVDYGDLLRSRGKADSELAHQKAGFQDLHRIAEREEVALWTASQAQRPKGTSDEMEHLIKARDIADAYAKIRLCDFIGSINQTNQERQDHRIRLFANEYRDNEAFATIPCYSNFSRMIFAAPLGYFN